MSEMPFKKDRATPLGSVEGEEDLKPRPAGDDINPTPMDYWCDCCGRHISELKPFGGRGDPLRGDFTGAYLVKTYRSAGTYDEEAEKAVEEACQHYKADGFDDILDWMINKYGRKKAEELYWPSEAYHLVGSSWECRDCILLDMDEYFEKLESSYYQWKLKES